VIPDSGTREELRTAWFNSCAVPLVGEVYRSSPHGHVYEFPDIWHVKKIRKHKVPPTVVIDIYVVTVTSVTHGKTHKNVEMELSEWKQKYQDGELHYKSTDVNAVVQSPWGEQ
jgi:hypothetical protein